MNAYPSFFLLASNFRRRNSAIGQPIAVMSQKQPSTSKIVCDKACHRKKRVACKTLGIPAPGKRRELARMTAGGKANFLKSKQNRFPTIGSNVDAPVIIPLDPHTDEEEVQFVGVLPASKTDPPVSKPSDEEDVVVIDDVDDDCLATTT